MIRICFSIICLMSIYQVFAQLTRRIKINETPQVITTVEEIVEKRTMRSYQTQSGTRMTRRTTTNTHILDKTCLLKPDSGPCRGKIPMWYFDPENMTCEAFYWGGCQGNGNRFDKLAQCTSTCLSAEGWKESRPRYCFLTFDYGWCFGAYERYYYDRQWGVCKKTIYSGCGGNKNNFQSKEMCDDVCRLGSFSLIGKIEKGKDANKILIVNPIALTERPSGPVVTTTTKTLTGSWWKADFQTQFRNKKIFLDINKETGPEKSTLSIFRPINK